jgi:hypothetical protein
MKIHLLQITHRHGVRVQAFLSLGEAETSLAEWAIDRWSERADKAAPEDHTQLTSIQIVDAYFHGHPSDSFGLDEDELPDPRVVVDVDGAIVTLVADREIRAVVKNYNADTFGIEQVYLGPQQVQVAFEQYAPEEAT